MPRPRVDAEAVRDRIVEIAETLLLESHGQRLVLSDIATRMGVSQPYIYRHFENKDALFIELARRWFEKVEAAGEDICRMEKPWQSKLRAHVLATLKLKRAAHDANPELFRAYLRIAQSYMDVIAQHKGVLISQMTEILAAEVPKKHLPAMVALTLDATVQFRVPLAIVNEPLHATPQRAKQVLDAVIAFIESRIASS